MIMCIVFTSYFLMLFLVRILKSSEKHKRPDISAEMPSTEVLLPKYITDSCYASLKQIYADMFNEPINSNRRTKSPLKRIVTNKAKHFSPDRAEKFKNPNATAMIQFTNEESGRSLETFPKNQKHRASWHAGQTNQIRDYTTFGFPTKF